MTQVEPSQYTSSIFGHCMPDIFTLNAKGWTVVLNYFNALEAAFNAMNKQSEMVTDYSNTVSLWKTKANFRITISFLIYCVVIHIVEAGILTPMPVPFPVENILIIVLINFGLYLCTFQPMQHATYRKLSVAISIFMFAVICWSRCALARRHTKVYTPICMLILATHIFLPVPSEFCVTMTVLALAYYAVPHIKQTNENYWISNLSDEDNTIPWTQFDVFRRLKVIKESNMKTVSQLFSDIALFVLLSVIATYISFWSRLRRNSVFIKLGKSVKARNQANQALKSGVRWIEAIMPSKVTADYHRLQQRKKYSGNDLWVYSKAFENVSILFADIVGFTTMSSNKTPVQLVTLLNDLFSRFDELCALTMCEKIGTLGDCYYCVAGCPQPNLMHASACVEMGLGMCRIIKVFNCDHDEHVGMRVGVHTGRVNAAIVGAKRFRYDVYSFDVIIANKLESTGRPGRVHISEATYAQIRSLYNVSRGEDLVVMREQQIGISGMALTTTSIQTYFVDPRSSQLKRKHEKFGQETDLFSCVRSDYDEPWTSASIRSKPSSPVENEINIERELRRSDRSDVPHQTDLERLSKDIELIENLQTDPERQIDLFRLPPLTMLWLRFLSPETEWHYMTHGRDHLKPTYIDSYKMAVLSDNLALCLSYLCIQVICMISHNNTFELTLASIIVYTIVFIIHMTVFLSIMFATTTYKDQLHSHRSIRFYQFVSSRVGQEISMGVMTCTPTIVFMVFRAAVTDSASLGHNWSLLSKLVGLCVLIHAIPVSSMAWCRYISCTITMLLIMSNTYEEERQTFCISQSTNQSDLPMKSTQLVLTLELLCCFIMVVMVARENEVNCRLCFYVTRESEIACDMSDISVNEAQELLFNIFPQYVYQELKDSGQFDVENRSFSYAIVVENVGVVFAGIANFFSHYYREDYQGGEASLRLLNSIICSFDRLLERPDMKDVEKIKSINDCYMAAAGLNVLETARNLNKCQHLISLMDYCHAIIEILDEFNDMYVVGTDKFYAMIGCNIGSVTAGIIGTRRPLFDIWGDTVNVASRMYSTGLTGKIQVPSRVASLLQDYFTFEYRGEVFVKGKGNMETFICTKLQPSQSITERNDFVQC